MGQSRQQEHRLLWGALLSGMACGYVLLMGLWIAYS